MGWEPNNSSVTRVDAPTDKPPAPGPKPKKRSKIVMEGPGPVKDGQYH